MKNNPFYPIVQYLNTNMLLDLLTLLEGGMPTLEITSLAALEGGRGETKQTSPMPLLRVALKEKASQKTPETKTYTPASLLAVLRHLMNQKKLLGSQLAKAKVGDWVESPVTLVRNPLIEALESRQTLTRMIVSPEENPVTPNATSAKTPNNSKVIQQVERILDQLKNQGSYDLLGVPEEEKITLVLHLNTALLPQGISPQATTAQMTGARKILGKVLQVIPAGTEQTYSLMRKGSLGNVDVLLLQHIFRDFKKVEETFSGHLPDLITHLQGPALSIIPLAILA